MYINSSTHGRLASLVTYVRSDLNNSFKGFFKSTDQIVSLDTKTRVPAHLNKGLVIVSRCQLFAMPEQLLLVHGHAEPRLYCLLHIQDSLIVGNPATKATLIHALISATLAGCAIALASMLANC